MNNDLSENLYEGEELDNSPEQTRLLTAIGQLLAENKMNQNLQDMDMQVARSITLDEFLVFRSYKDFCVGQLYKYCDNQAMQMALEAAIQQGFMLGYWTASQHQK